jgi:hypothetical protein
VSEPAYVLPEMPPEMAADPAAVLLDVLPPELQRQGQKLLARAVYSTDRKAREEAVRQLARLDPNAPPDPVPPNGQLNAALLMHSSTLVSEGRRVIAEGVRYLVDGMIPGYGMTGFLAGYAKVGKSSGFGMPLIQKLSTGEPFLGRATKRVRCLYLGLEDPREYLGWMAARSLSGSEDALFYCGSLSLNDATVHDIEALIRGQGIGFMYVSTYMAGVRELLKNENDNTEQARVVESLKASSRRTGVPYLFEAHAGKGEDQSADADPIKALRGASAGAAAADFVLSLKRDGPGMTTRRMVAGAGRFVNFAPISYDYNPHTGEVEFIGAQKDASAEITIRLIREMGAVVEGEERSVSAVMKAAGADDKGSNRAAFRLALEQMPEVVKVVSSGKGGKTARYRLTTSA